MIILTLDTKSCMAHLLLKETFHSYFFIEGEVTTYNRFAIDGYIHKNFFEDPPTQEYSYWKDLREYCFSLIRGTRTPLSFKFIFSLAKENLAEFLTTMNLSFQPEDISGLYLNFRFDGSQLQCTTGTSMHTFTLDKSLDAAWDEYVRLFFEKVQIPWTLDS